MQNKRSILLLLAFAALTAAKIPWHSTPVVLEYPASWPKPAYDFSKNPLTREGIALGRKLFYDPALSRDSSVSCSNCHLSYTAFTHVDHALSHGIEDRIGTRNSPALMNLAWSNSFMWDGSVNHLDFQALAPIAHPAEMDFSLEAVVQRLQRKQDYRAFFHAAFADSSVTGERLLKAMAQFELSLVSANAKYDRVMAGEEPFTTQEQQGYLLFQKNCASCHAEPFFTNHGFEKNGLPPDTTLLDFGRMRITGLTADSLRFKVPTLRNIEFSYPYMHDGRFRKLRQVLDYYSSGAALNKPITLTANEKVDLQAFLLTLTDRAFLFNPAFAFPRE
ncbi:MAG: cytochrome-c peroxidase [Chitinophagales bacterium]|nr:cytochrome-c peroxidase [Chitinophagales bacterium]